MSWQMPVQGKITSQFGGRTPPTAGASSYHQGIDISVPVGTPVMAAASGSVIKAGWDKVRGYFVQLDHGGGFTSIYQHLKMPTVKAGVFVQGGQKIALSGNTGVSTGPHLHFEVQKDGKAIDPYSWDGSASVIAQVMDQSGLVELIKQYWLYITIGLVVMAVIRK